MFRNATRSDAADRKVAEVLRNYKGKLPGNPDGHRGLLVLPPHLLLNRILHRGARKKKDGPSFFQSYSRRGDPLPRPPFV